MTDLLLKEMRIEKYTKNLGEFKKNIQNNHITYNKRMVVSCYTWLDESKVCTDLEVGIYSKDGTLLDTYSFSGIETECDAFMFHSVLSQHREKLSSHKEKLFSYLQRNFFGVEMGEDYTQ